MSMDKSLKGLAIIIIGGLLAAVYWLYTLLPRWGN